jgi:hypothetical protein
MIIAILVLSIINVVFTTLYNYVENHQITFNIPSTIIIVLTIIMLVNNIYR